MVIFIDTNVIIDFLTERSNFYYDAKLIFERCATGILFGYTSANTIADVFYILRKDYSVKARKAKLYDLCEFVRVIGLEHRNIVSAITNNNFNDLEDCLQSECAEKAGAKYIITRDISDFANSTIPAITPSAFLNL